MMIKVFFLAADVFFTTNKTITKGMQCCSILGNKMFTLLFKKELNLVYLNILMYL